MGPTEVTKLAPARVILLILLAVADVVKVMVTEVLVSLTLLERATEGLTSAALNIAGKATEATVSNVAVAVAVVIVTPVDAAAAAAAFLSPDTVHVTAMLAAMDAGVVTFSTRLEELQTTVPADRPVQE